MPKPTKSTIASTINRLHRQLRAEYGSDFSYTILAQGTILGASNSTHGYLKPETERRAKRVRS